MPQFPAPGPPPRATNNGGWQVGYPKEGFPGVDAIRQLSATPITPAPAPVVRPTLPQTLSAPSPFGTRPAAAPTLQPGFPLTSPGLNAGVISGFPSRPVAPTGFNMASVATQQMARPSIAPTPLPAAPAKTGGSLAEQLAARAGNLKSASAPPPAGKTDVLTGRSLDCLKDKPLHDCAVDGLFSKI